MYKMRPERPVAYLNQLLFTNISVTCIVKNKLTSNDLFIQPCFKINKKILHHGKNEPCQHLNPLKPAEIYASHVLQGAFVGKDCINRNLLDRFSSFFQITFKYQCKNQHKISSLNSV